jgi:NADH-quinone oxidoreductase subunit C
MKSNCSLYSHLNSKYSSDFIEIIDCEDNFVLIKIKSNQIHNTIKNLKNDCVIQSLMSICCVDYPQNKNRFELIYNFIDIDNNARLILKTQVSEGDLIESITSIFPNAQWYEREVWDFYGILFSGNNDMRRILTDYGFIGHPMRKDFPLTGYTEMHYNNSKGGVTYDTVKLQQDFRQFESQSQWNIGLLPGDEKASSNK